MIKFALLALMPLCLSCGDSTQPKHGASPAETAPPPLREKMAQPAIKAADMIVVYAWNNVADVYDLGRKWAEVRSRNHLNRPTEFGGSLVSCSDERMHCLMSHLEIVVPRHFPFPSTWSAAGYQCRQLQIPVDDADIVKAECRIRADQATTFEYSPKRGILRYRRMCPKCRSGAYELLSERGLFPAS